MIFDIIFSYDFYVVAIGVCILAIASAMVGCFSVYKGQSLVGDAIGHSSYAGVVLAFMIFQTKNPLILTLGAGIIGAISYHTINVIINNSKIRLDSALAIVLSGFFGLGLVLDSFIQGNANFSNASQAGLRNYIFGQASYIMREDIIFISSFSAISIILMLMFYKELIICIFDKDYAKSLGYSTKMIDNVLLVMMISLICVGLKTVGAILISSFLIIPCIAASQHSKNIKNVLILSSIIASVSSFSGVLISSTVDRMSTGPTIIIVMCILTLLSMVLVKYGMIAERKVRIQI